MDENDVYVVQYILPRQGTEIKIICKSLIKAIKYIEETYIPIHKNTKYIRDDSKLEHGELASWYQIDENQEVLYESDYITIVRYFVLE